MTEETKDDLENNEPEGIKIFLSDELQQICKELLQRIFRIKAIYGVKVYFDPKDNKYHYRQSKHKICILVVPKKKCRDPIYYEVQLGKYPGFVALGILNVSAAKLTFMAIKGFVYADLDCEHRCHRHNGINILHLNFVPSAVNQHRKSDQKDLHEFQPRNKKTGRFAKAPKCKTYQPTECNHGPGVPDCMYNLRKSDAADWKDPEQREVYKTVVKKYLPGIELAPFW